MANISEEKINLNYTQWINKLKKYNCYSEEMIEALGEKIKIASFSLNENNGGAYKGSLLDVVLYKLCVLGAHMNVNALVGQDKEKALHPSLAVNMDSLMRVLLLQHIAKSVMFVPESNEWKKKNGALYTFSNELPTVLKLGERSILMCMTYGIKLTEEEYEAMRIIDRKDDEIVQYVSPLSLLVKIINQMVSVEIYNKNFY